MSQVGFDKGKELEGVTSQNSHTLKSQPMNSNFLTNTKRADFWVNKIDAPYTKPTSALNPGPGKYNLEKKKDDIKTKILLEDTVHVPFNSSVERDCN